MSSRLSFPRGELRRRTVRGAVVTAASSSDRRARAAAGARGLAAARPAEIGLYGIVSTRWSRSLALKRVGIDEAFVQQDTEAGATSSARLHARARRSPAWRRSCSGARAGARRRLRRSRGCSALTLGVAWLPLAFALLAPLWVFFRRMDFARSGRSRRSSRW